MPERNNGIREYKEFVTYNAYFDDPEVSHTSDYGTKVKFLLLQTRKRIKKCFDVCLKVI